MSELFRYAAFISYSSKDAAFAKRLHRALEAYGVPSALGSFDLIGGGKKNRIYPVFRDREELAAGDLGERIEASLRASAALIVVCSPNSAASPWVQKEIDFFATMRRERIFAIIAEDAPIVDETGADATPLSLPPAFRGDALTDPNALEPLAADARKGKDGFRNAWLKLVAGMVGVTPGQIIDRDRKRRRQQRLAIAAGVVGFALIAGVSAASVDALSWRTRLTSYAEGLAGQGRPNEAIAYALAGVNGAGDILRARSDRADAVLASVGSLRVVAAFPEVNGFEFSASGTTLTFFDQNDAFVAYSPQSGERRLIDMLDGRLSGDGNTIFGFRENRHLVVADLASGAPPRSLGELSAAPIEILLSRDGSVGILQLARGSRDYGDVFVYNLADGGPPRALGVHALLDAEGFAADGSVLVARRNDQLVAYDLVNGGAPRTFGRAEAWGLRPDGGALIVRDLDLNDIEYDLRGDAAPRNIGRAGNRFLAPDGVTVAVVSEGGDLALYRPGAEEPTPLIDMGRRRHIEFSSDSARLAFQDEAGEVWVYELAGEGSLRSLGLAPDMSMRFSTDGAMLLYWGNGIPSSIQDLNHDDRRHDLGRVRAVDFSDANTMAVAYEEGGLSLFDLSEPAVENGRRGAVLRQGVCDASISGVWPFVEELAGGDSEESQRANDRVNQALRGRLWNPCDWRGFGAVFPNAERGDGWFEGARQWLRLMSVRYFGGDDWVCDETTTRASEAMRTARAQACARFDMGEGDET
jgi:hypothetical protein